MSLYLVRCSGQYGRIVLFIFLSSGIPLNYGWKSRLSEEPSKLGPSQSSFGELVSPVMVHFKVKPVWSKQGPVRVYLYNHPAGDKEVGGGVRKIHIG